MKKILSLVLVMVAGQVLADGPVIQTTPYTQAFLNSQNAAAAQTALNLAGVTSLTVVSNTAVLAVQGSHITNAVVIGATVTNSTFAGTLVYGNYIWPTNAAADGVTDDTLWLSNAIVHLNDTTQPLVTLDLLGKVYAVTTNLPLVTRYGATVQNGQINYFNTNLYCLGIACTNTVGSGGNGNDRLLNLVIARSGGSPILPPNTNCVGLYLGDLDGTYGVNCLVQNCRVTNFWRGIQINGMSQTVIKQCFVFDNWSNDIYVANQGGADADPDMIWIQQDDLNHREFNGGAFLIQQATNCVGIQCDNGCLDFRVEGCNGGGEKQALRITPFQTGKAAIVSFVGNEYEGMETVNTNLCPIEIWNSQLSLYGAIPPIDGGFGSSNYIAQIGLYATNGAHLNLQLDEIRSYGAAIIDAWAPNWNLESSYFVPTRQASTEIFHTAWQDIGTYFSFGNSGSDPAQWINTNQILITTAPFNGLQGSGGQIDIFGGGGGGIIVDNNGDAVDFTTAGAVNFNGIALQNISDRGGIPGLQFFCPNTHIWQFYSLNNSTPDLSATNNVLALNAITQGIGSKAAGSCQFGTSGLTNTLSVNLMVYGFNGNSVWISNALTGFKVNLGNTSGNSTFVLQPGEAIIGTSCTEAANTPF